MLIRVILLTFNIKWKFRKDGIAILSIANAYAFVSFKIFKNVIQMLLKFNISKIGALRSVAMMNPIFTN